jgi:flavin-dependent dehydrogenase
MAVGREGYVGAVRVEKGYVDVAAAIDTESISARDGSIGEVVSRILEENGAKNRAESLRHAAWKGTPFLSRQRKSLGGTRLFFVGDAAGYVEPFTGEGIAWALMGGRLVAPIVQEAVNNWNPTLVDSWQDAHREVIRAKQHICQVARLVLRHPLPSRFLIRLSRLNPRWALQVLDSINRPAGRKAATL